tara:strand:+ start:538 stop:1380 length:843 start_codon:yes stop_codon:yes gene_type:complete
LKYFTVIFGSNSFSGHHLSSFFSKKKLKVFGTYRSKEKHTFNTVQKKINLTKKINLNVKSNNLIIISSIHKIKDFQRDQFKNYNNNILIVKNAIQFAKNNNIKNVIYFSTIDINSKKWPYLKKKYILSKEKSEKILTNAYKKGIFRKLIILRLPAIIGKNCNSNFIVTLLNSLKLDKKVKLWNHNKVYRNFIHIEELCKLIYFLLKSKKLRSRIIECQNSGGNTLIELVNYAKNKINSLSSIEFKTNKVPGKIKYINKIQGFKFKDNFFYFKKFLEQFKF